jgi:exodeoxyribonuclease-1
VALREAAAWSGGLWAEVFTRPAPSSAADVDEDLYGGFIGPADRRTLERLRKLPPDALAAKLPAFEDARLDELFFRYRARNFPDSLGVEDQQRWLQHCHARLHEGAAGYMTVAQFLDRIDQLSETAEDERSQDLLGALVDWAEQVAPETV